MEGPPARTVPRRRSFSVVASCGVASPRRAGQVMAANAIAIQAMPRTTAVKSGTTC